MRRQPVLFKSPQRLKLVLNRSDGSIVRFLNRRCVTLTNKLLRVRDFHRIKYCGKSIFLFVKFLAICRENNIDLLILSLIIAEPDPLVPPDPVLGLGRRLDPLHTFNSVQVEPANFLILPLL